MIRLDDIAFGTNGLITAIVQDADTKRVLMLAHMNREALQQTLDTSLATFWSRSRNELWVKGMTSGNTQLVREIQQDCDSDALLLLVTPNGPACHNGSESCFDTASTKLSVQNKDGNA